MTRVKKEERPRRLVFAECGLDSDLYPKSEMAAWGSPDSPALDHNFTASPLSTILHAAMHYSLFPTRVNPTRVEDE